MCIYSIASDVLYIVSLNKCNFVSAIYSGNAFNEILNYKCSERE